MKKFHSHLFSQTAIVMVLSFLCLNFVACNNFLNSKDVKNEIETAIAYNNSKKVNVMILCPEGMGTVYPRNQLSVRLDYDFELQFKLNTKDYCIKDPSTIFEAVKYSDPTISMSDYVEFTAIPQTTDDELEGIYRAKAKVVKEATDILIQPKCLLIPEISSVQANMTNGILSPGNPVTVIFNMPVDSEKLNYTNITIKALGNDISELFEDPEPYENKLIIRPKFEQLRNYIENRLSLKTLEVTFSFRDSITATVDGITLNLKQNENSSFKLIYNSVSETDAPNCNTFYVTSKPITLESASSLDSSNYFSFSCTSNEEKLKNRTKGIIYLYGIYNDQGSGIRVVKLQVQKNKNLRNKDIHKITRYSEYYPYSPKSNFLIKENGNVSFCLEYEFIDGDGTYELEFIVEDGCGNQSKKQITVFVENELYGHTHITNEKTINNDNPPLISEYHEALKILSIPYGIPWDPDGPYGNPNFEIYGPGEIAYDFNHCDIVCKYIGRDGTETEAIRAKYTEPDTSLSTLTFKLDVDSVAGLLIKIIVTTDIGTQFIEQQIIPEKPVLTSKTVYSRDDDEDEAHFDVEFNNPSGESWGRLLKLSGVDKLQDISRRGWCVEGETIYFSCGSLLYGPVSDPITIDSEPVTLNTININDYTIRKSLINDKGYDVTLNVNPAEWERYDSIYLINSYEGTEKQYFNKDTNSCTFTTINDFFYNGLKVKLFGIKNNQTTESSYVIYNFDREEQDEFGRLPPFVKYYRYVDDIRFEIVDNESGIASATIEFCNQPDNENFEPIILDEDDISTYYYDQGAFIFTIPIWKIGEAGGIVINATDKKGNVMPEEFFYPDLNCYGGMHYAYDCQVSVLKWYPSGGHYYADEIHWKVGVSFWENLTSYRNLYLDKWDNSNGCFQNSISRQLNYTFGNDQEIDFGELNTGFYKVSSSEVFYSPYYFYVGSHSAEWDFLVSNAENNKSVLIQSDAPVYVCTYITNVPYEECVNYDVNFWEEYKRVTDEQIFEFSNSNHDFKSYKIDLDKIPKNYSYVVVAHYADGKKMKSHVYYKDWE